MAKKMTVGEEDVKSLEQIQREISETELLTKQLQLAEAKERNQQYVGNKEARGRRNRQRQADLAQMRNAREALVKGCRHKSGGNPANVLRGGGIGSFSIITRALMPDGVTRFLQCSRCRMGRYFRVLSSGEEALLANGDAAKYRYYLEGKKLYEVSIDQGLEHAELRGPTFFFQNAAGVPIVPEMV